MKATCSRILGLLPAALILLASARLAAAQDGEVWRIELKAPTGFSDQQRSNDSRRFIRRLPKQNEQIRIQVAIIASTADRVESFLDDELGNDQRSDVPDREFNALGGKALGRAFIGTTELLGKSFRHERLVLAKKLDAGHFLRIVAMLYHAEPEPSPRLRQIMRAATDEILADLRVDQTEGPVEGDAETDLPENEPAPRDGGQFTNDGVLPFRFDYPLDWYVGYKDKDAPGLLWVLATPTDADGLVPAEEEIAVALRVTVFGTVTELIGAEDELERASQLLLDDWKSRPEKPSLELMNEALLGGAKGRIYRFTETAGRKDAGLLLVAVADSGLIIAEYRCQGVDFAGREAEGRRILGSFAVEPQRGRIRIDAAPFSFEQPEGFTIEEVGTADSSRAWVLRQPGIELFLRSFVVADADAPDDAAPRKLAAALFGEVLEMGKVQAIESALPLVVPGAAGGIQHFAILQPASNDRRAADLFAFRRGGALHFAVLSTTQGVDDHSRGRLLEMLCGLSGPGQLALPVKMGDDGLLSDWVCLRHFEPRPFADDGSQRTTHRGMLILAPDGKAWMRQMSGRQVSLRRGSYRKVGESLIVTFSGSSPLSFTWSREERLATDGEGRRWYPAPSF